MWCFFVFLLLNLVTTKQQSMLDGLINLINEGQNQISAEPDDMPQSNLLKEYDFIIVGAGTAGCVLANRLSEIEDWKILLIEAGRPENYLMDLPLLVNYLQFSTTNWAYRTLPSQNYCLGMENQQCHWPRGKVMGGSSVLNYMIYTRGNRRDYDRWYEFGNDGWSFKDVLPYFKKIENYQINRNDTEYHNYDGYLTIDYSPYKTKIADAIIEASQEYDFKTIDYNGRNQIGVSRLQLSMKNGVRESASRAYLHPIKQKRPNLHVKKYAMVTRLLIDPITKKTLGIEYERNQRFYRIFAKKEVILAAGAINSPQLLMLSGIGPKKHLQKKNIKVLSNLKVGYNLQDHIATGGLTFLINQSFSLTLDRMLNKEALSDYFNYHRGPLTIPGGCEVILFYNTKEPGKKLDDYPDMELLFQGGSITSDPLLYKDFGIKQEMYNEIYKPIINQDTFMVFPMLLKPKSRGRIMLNDNNYKTKPLIYANYFQDHDDMKTILDGIRLIFNITKQPALQKLGTKFHTMTVKECEKYRLLSDDYFECITRYFTFTIYHQSGTCKMGPKTDPHAVVDPRLRVYGIKNLRVIDASIMPEIPAGHTNAPTFMVAEKGADMIKQDWGVL